MRVTLRDTLFFWASALLCATGVFAYDSPPSCQFGVGQCKPGFVWRDANDTDHVCVPGPSRDRVMRENQEAASRTEPNSETCKFGFVWRDGNKSDHACVTGTSRTLAASETRTAAGRIDAKCTVGAVCKFNCDAEKKSCEDVNDGRDCRKVRAQCMRNCVRELNLTTPH